MRSVRWRITLIALLLILGFLILNLTGLSIKIKAFFFSVSAGIQKSLWGAGESFSGFFSGVFSQTDLKHQVLELQQNNQELAAEFARLMELEKENQALREALQIQPEEDFQKLLGRVISKDFSQDSLLIDKGERQGILPGMPVLSPQSTLLGSIGGVYDNFSELVLITNQESSFDAKIPEKDIYGVIKGKGRLALSFELIPKEGNVSVGDLVITVALGRVFPSGILAGKIEEVKKLDIESFQRAEVRPSFNLENLDYLFIITNF